MAAFTRTPTVAVDPGLTQATVSWEVDTAAYGQVGYDTDPNNLVNHIVFDSNFTTAHSVLLDSLTPECDYTYIVVVIDEGGNTVCDSGKLTFRTSAAPAPVITDGPTTAVHSDTVDIAWSANVSGSGQVYFGPDAASLNNMVSDPTVSNDHVVTLQGLNPSTKYAYQCCNSDPATGDVLAESSVLSFTTEAAPPATGGRLVRACAAPRRVRRLGTTQLRACLLKAGFPIAGAPVTFEVKSRNGSLAGPATVPTDETGWATTTFKAGAKPGFVLVKVSSPNAVNIAFILFLIRRV